LVNSALGRKTLAGALQDSRGTSPWKSYIRSSSIRALKRANFEDRDVATLSGHKNLVNLSNYQIPTVTDRTRMAIRDPIHHILRIILFLPFVAYFVIYS
jgi:hypothetical protein